MVVGAIAIFQIAVIIYVVFLLKQIADSLDRKLRRRSRLHLRTHAIL